MLSPTPPPTPALRSLPGLSPQLPEAAPQLTPVPLQYSRPATPARNVHAWLTGPGDGNKATGAR